jgi:hypothetical protein
VLFILSFYALRRIESRGEEGVGEGAKAWNRERDPRSLKIRRTGA